MKSQFRAYFSLCELAIQLNKTDIVDKNGLHHLTPQQIIVFHGERYIAPVTDRLKRLVNVSAKHLLLNQ